MNQDHALFDRICEATGLDPATAGEGAMTFNYGDHRVLVEMKPQWGCCLVSAQLHSLVGAARPEALSELLEANHLLCATGGGGLSWSHSTAMISLNMTLPLGEASVLMNQLNNFLHTVDQWTARIIAINNEACARASARLHESMRGAVGLSSAEIATRHFM